MIIIDRPQEQDELKYYNLSMLDNKQKVFISIILGFFSLVFAPLGIKFFVTNTQIDIPWSFIFTVLAAMAFGWRYGLIASISGAIFSPFLLWPEDGFANIVTSIIYLMFFTLIGKINGMDLSRKKLSNVLRFLLLIAFMSLTLYLVYRFLYNYFFELNRIYLGGKTYTYLNPRLLTSFAIKDSVNFALLILLADLLLRLPFIRTFFRIPTNRTMRYNTRILIVTIIVCQVIWFVYISIGHYLLEYNGLLDGHDIIAIFTILCGGLIASRFIIYYTEKVLKVNESLISTENYLKLHFERLPIAYIVLDDKLNIKGWNPAAETIFGYTEMEVLGKSAFDTIIPKSIESDIVNLWDKVIKSGEKNQNINYNLTKSGDTIICDWINSPVVDGDGNVLEVISMVSDITEKKISEETLEFLALQKWEDQKEHFFHAITKYLTKTLGFDYVLISTVEMDYAFTKSYCCEGRIINNINYALRGTPCSNVYGKVMCVYPENIQNQFPEDNALVKMNAESYVGQPLWDSTGKPLGLIALISKKRIQNPNITKSVLNIVATRVSAEIERQKLEDSQKKTQSNLLALVDRDQPIWSIDRNYNLVFINKFFKDQFFLAFGKVLEIGVNALDILEPELRDFWKIKYDEALAGQKVLFEFKQQVESEENAYEVFFNPIIYEGEVAGVSAITIDITKRKKADNEIIRAKERAEESEKTLKESQMMAKLGSWELDIESGIFTFNDNFYKIFHTTVEEVGSYNLTIQEYARLFVHPDDASLVSEETRKAIESDDPGFTRYVEHRILYKGGEIGYMGVKFFVVKDKNGKTIKTYGVNQDITERKKSEILLKEINERYENFISQVSEGVYRFELKNPMPQHLSTEEKIEFLYDNMVLAECNPSFISMYGVKDQNELIGKTQEYFHGGRNNSKNRKSLQSFVENGYNTKNAITEEINFAGSHWICSNNAFGVLENNHLVRIWGTQVDITDSIKAENELKESRANLSAIIENTNDNIWAINTSYDIIYINKAFQNAFEYSYGVKLYSGVNILELIPKNLRDKWLGRYRRAFKGERFTIEDSYLIDGKSNYFEISVNPIIIDHQVAGVSCFSRDITERKIIENKIKLSEERFKTVAESADEWIWEVDGSGLYTYSNSVVEKILGYKPEEVVGKKYFYDLFDPNVKDLLKDMALKMFSQKKPIKDFVNFNLNKQGKQVILKTTGSAVLNEKGDLLGYRGADIDITQRKEMEIAIKESEEKYRLSFMTSPDSINLNKLDGTYIEINDGFTKLTGFTREDVIGKSSLEINIWHNPEDREKLVNGLRDGGLVENLEALFRFKNGSLRTGLMSARIIIINKEPHILSITRDITERKELEKALINSEEQYRMLFERSSDAIFKVDKKTSYYLDANKAAEELTGYKLKELKKLRTFDLTPKGAKGRREKVLKQKTAFNLGEVEFNRKDGTKRIALLSIIPLDENIVFSIAHDVTEQKAYEDALRTLTRAVDQSPVSVVITDVQGRIEYVNPKFTRITGYSLQEAIGLTPGILKSGYTTAVEYKNLWNTIRDGKEWSGEFCNIKKNGEKYWEFALISPITNEKGEITHFVAVKEDITEKKETDRLILSSIITAEERERNRFSRELHDGLGPLLSTIKLYFQWLSETNDPDKKKIIIEKGDKNLNDAIETIREISNNLSPRTLNSFGFFAALKNFIDNLNQTQKLHIELITNTESRLDANLEVILYRICSELINNTLKYAKATKSVVNFHYDEKVEKITLVYTDDGKGFDINLVKQRQKGLGLLHIEQRINTLKGKTKIESEPGKGIRVVIEIPTDIKESIKL